MDIKDILHILRNPYDSLSEGHLDWRANKMKYALTVGVNKYGNGADLAGCVNDSNDWTLALNRYGFQVRTMLDKEATGKNIRAAIAELVDKASPGDTVVFQYSGHGSFTPDLDGDEPDGADECICPVDIFKNGPITDDELYRLYANRSLGIKLVIISDSCHSGSVSRFMSIGGIGSINWMRNKVRFLPPAAFLSEKEANELNSGFRRSLPAGRHAGLLLSGCLDVEYSFDAWFNDRPNGAFSYVALQTLAKLPKMSSYQRWYTAIRKALPSQDYPQTPNFYGSSVMKKWHVFE
jgi:hypothetical protein